jgi:hypothetical protein
LKNITNKLLFILLLTSPTFLSAYIDSDYDGVSDSRDYCPNSSFDDIVDKFGCIKSKNITLMLGGELSSGDYGGSETISSSRTTLYSAYNSGFWSLSLSTSYATSSSESNESLGMGDLYTSVSYHGLGDRKHLVSLQLTTKIATADETLDLGTGENDYTIGLSTVTLAKDVNYLFSGSYTLTGDTTTVDYNNVLSISAGIGKQQTSKVYSSASFHYASPFLEDSDAAISLSGYLSYALMKDNFITASYIFGISDAVADHTVSVNYGIKF